MTQQGLSEWYLSLADDSGKLMYLPNDPATPKLVLDYGSSQMPDSCPAFEVVGWTGYSGIPGTPQFQAAQVHCSILSTVRMVHERLGRPLPNWPGTSKLIAYPRSGNTFNAFYDRASLRFFYNPHPVTKKVVFASESADIVSHELGHGILDALRPDLWHTASLEIFAFHEAFGDIMAICSALSWPSVIARVLDETNGDIACSNCVSRIAEEMGSAIHAQTRGKVGRENCLRDASNNYRYFRPDTLPPGSPVSNEAHSFSQIFSGAWYAMLAAVQKQMVQEGVTHMESVAKARDLALSTLLEAVVKTPEVHEFFSAIAAAIVEASKNIEGGKYESAIRSAFVSRSLLHAHAAMGLSSTSDIDSEVEGHKANVELDSPIIGHAKIVLHLPKFVRGRSLTGSATERCLELSKEAVIYAHQRGLVGRPEDDTMFSIKDGRFVRNFVCEWLCKSCQ